MRQANPKRKRGTVVLQVTPRLRFALVAASVGALIWTIYTCPLPAAVPQPTKVVVVIEENKTYSSIVGDPCCPFISSLAAGGANFTQSYALTYPSQPNYIGLFSGSLQGVSGSGYHPPSQFQTPNLGSKLREANYTFLGFAEDLPYVGYDSEIDQPFGPTYARRHNPWVNWQDANAPTLGQPNPTGKLPPLVNRPFTDFPQGPGADYRWLPDVSFVVPNVVNDMHDGGAAGRAVGDAWVQANLGGFADWAMENDGLLIVTFDEDDRTGNNRIPTIFYGGAVQPGNYDTRIDHYAVLRTMEAMFSLPHTANSITARTIDEVWKPSPWHRAANPLDVDGDGQVAPIDAHLVINELNRDGSHPLSVTLVDGLAPPPFFDTDADYHVAPNDAHLVINELNQTSPLSLWERAGMMVDAPLFSFAEPPLPPVSAARMAVVPEPGGLVLGGLAATAVGLLHLRRRRLTIHVITAVSRKGINTAGGKSLSNE
jgi:acid phosphatase